MSSARDAFSKQFEFFKSSAVAQIGELAKYMARFASIHGSRSHHTKQLAAIRDAEFGEHTTAYDAVFSLVKRMRKTAEAVGAALDPRVAVTRDAVVAEFTEIRTEWLRRDTPPAPGESGAREPWAGDAPLEMLRFVAGRMDALATALKHNADAIKAFRVAMTAHLNSPAFRAVAAANSPEYAARLAEATAEVAARAAAGPPAPVRVRRVRATETELGDEDSAVEGVDDDEAAEDASEVDNDGTFVGDDEPIERAPPTILDDGSDVESIDTDASTTSESSADDAGDADEPVVRRTLPERAGKRRALDSIAQQAADERQVRRRFLEGRGVAAEDIDSGDDGVSDESVEAVEDDEASGAADESPAAEEGAWPPPPPPPPVEPVEPAADAV